MDDVWLDWVDQGEETISLPTVTCRGEIQILPKSDFHHIFPEKDQIRLSRPRRGSH